jgi:hypothetical protein
MTEACYPQLLSLPGSSSTIMSRIKRETEEGSRWNCPFGLAFFVARRACRQLEPKPADAVHPVLSWHNTEHIACDRNYRKNYVWCLSVSCTMSVGIVVHSVFNNDVSTMRLRSVQQTGKLYVICFNVPKIGCF